jgi:hypothetical protein
MKRVLLVAGTAFVLLAGLAGTANANTQAASAFAPYQIPPERRSGIPLHPGRGSS